jgi:acyl-CoA thioester hydrolase
VPTDDHATAGPADPADAFGPDWCRVLYEPGDVPTITVRDRVRLSDTDSSGLIYYGSVTSWLTRAQAELYLALGFRPQGNAPNPMTPVVNANISYHAPLRLADPYELRAWIDEVGTTSLSVGFEVTCAGTRCLTATMTHVHLDATTHRPIPLPPAFTAAARSRR